MEKYDLIVIGGGPAGMSCAISAKKMGVEKILLIERRDFLGGMLKQCIHDGFGLLTYGKSLTGPQFSQVLQKDIKNLDINIETGAFVSNINYDKKPYEIEYISKKGEIITCDSKCIVVATGCREKPFGSLKIPGTRPAGIFSAGSAQYMMNVQNILPGKSVVILGLGDIGMIMARRLTLEGAKVKLMAGLEMTGLKRNLNQCVKDFNIPFKEGYTVVSVHGRKRLKGVNIAPLDKDKIPIMSKKQYIPCDTLLVAVGLVPEKDLCPEQAKEGVFLCGNVNKIFSLVDYVKNEGEYVGIKVAHHILGNTVKVSSALSKIKKEISKQNESFQSFSSDNSILCCGCPKGCNLNINVTKEKSGDEVIEVSGNDCPVGEKYAKSEYKNPKRILTTTVKVKDEPFCLLPVKSDKPIEQGKMLEAMKIIRKIVVDKNIKNESIIAENILGTDVNIVVLNSSKISGVS